MTKRKKMMMVSARLNIALVRAGTYFLTVHILCAVDDEDEDDEDDE